jgi:anti-sigma regulatory factor (Ser/Thr protein kinase)
MTAGTQRLPTPPSPGGLAELRRWARSWMEQHATDGVDPDIVLLSMTELVTNSIKHGSGPVDVRLNARCDNLVLTVSDRSEQLPRRPDTSMDREAGRGIQIMESLATRWGVQPEPGGGKSVWCEFAAR